MPYPAFSSLFDILHTWVAGSRTVYCLPNNISRSCLFCLGLPGYAKCSCSASLFFRQKINVVLFYWTQTVCTFMMQVICYVFFINNAGIQFAYQIGDISLRCEFHVKLYICFLVQMHCVKLMSGITTVTRYYLLFEFLGIWLSLHLRYIIWI